MNSFELNKIAGAVLATCLGLLVINFTANAIFSPEVPEKPGYEIAVKEEDAGAGHDAKPAEAEKPIALLLTNASAEKGASAAKKCAACHDFTKGGPNKVGPNLYGIVNRQKAAHGGFAYSDAMKAKGGEWTYDELNAFIKNPKADIPGTKMVFAGISKESERADLILYLRSLAESPAPLPQAAAAPAPAGDAAPPAQGGAPAGNAAPAAPADTRPNP